MLSCYKFMGDSTATQLKPEFVKSGFMCKKKKDINKGENFYITRV